MVLLITDWTDAPPPTDFLTPRERVLAEHWPTWRAAEFTRGRVTAKAAVLAATGTPPADVEILRAPNGAPEPLVQGHESPWRLSISHSGAVCAAVVGPRATPIGVDVQPRDSRDRALARRLCGPADRIPPGTDATVVVSCKEAAYKACGQSRLPLGYGLRFPNSRSITVCPPCGATCGPLFATVHSHGRMVVSVVSSTAVSPRVVIDSEWRMLRGLREGTRP